MSEYFDLQKLEKNSIEELQILFFELDEKIVKVKDLIDESKLKRDDLQCAQWNIQEIIRKKKKNLR
jgi:hypothetical protein